MNKENPIFYILVYTKGDIEISNIPCEKEIAEVMRPTFYKKNTSDLALTFITKHRKEMVESGLGTYEMNNKGRLKFRLKNEPK